MRFSTVVPAFLVVVASAAAVAAPPGDRLFDQVTQAYQDTQQYQAVTKFEVTQRQGRWQMSQSTDIPTAFDRAQGQLAIDKPDLLVVVDDRLKLKSDQLPGRHLDAEAPSPLTYESLMQEVPFLMQPAMPDVAFLLASDPLAVLSNGAAGSVTTLDADPEDDQARLRLRFDAGDATYTLSIDPDTHLIEKAVIEVDASQFGGPGASGGGGAQDMLRFTYDYEIQRHNQPLAAQAFAFDAAGSTAAGSLQELMGGPGAGAGAGAGGSGGHALEGQNAPAITLARADGGEFKLEDAEQDVIVLDFWATWCPPCVEAMPKLQEVSDWAAKEGKSVGVYAVNVGETVDLVEPFMQRHGLSMPVLMDSEGTVAQAYGVTGIPQTVVIADGKVQHVHVGFSPNMADTLKSQIDPLLAD